MTSRPATDAVVVAALPEIAEVGDVCLRCFGVVQPTRQEHRGGDDRRRCNARHPRVVARGRRAPEGAGVRARRRVPARDGRADARVRVVRRDHPDRVRWSRSRRRHLLACGGDDLARVDGAHRRHQLAPDDGRAGAALRHRRPARVVPAPLRLRRAARRPGAHRTRLRHRPPGDPHDRRSSRRFLRAQWHQDVDHQRPVRQLSGGAGENRHRGAAAPPWDVAVRGAQGARLHRAAQTRQDGLQEHRHL